MGLLAGVSGGLPGRLRSRLRSCIQREKNESTMISTWVSGCITTKLPEGTLRNVINVDSFVLLYLHTLNPQL